MEERTVAISEEADGGCSRVEGSEEWRPEEQGRYFKSNHMLTSPSQL